MATTRFPKFTVSPKDSWFVNSSETMASDRKDVLSAITDPSGHETEPTLLIGRHVQLAEFIGERNFVTGRKTTRALMLRKDSLALRCWPLLTQTNLDDMKSNVIGVCLAGQDGRFADASKGEPDIDRETGLPKEGSTIRTPALSEVEEPVDRYEANPMSASAFIDVIDGVCKPSFDMAYIAKIGTDRDEGGRADEKRSTTKIVTSGYSSTNAVADPVYDQEGNLVEWDVTDVTTRSFAERSVENGGFHQPPDDDDEWDESWQWEERFAVGIIDWTEKWSKTTPAVTDYTDGNFKYDELEGVGRASDCGEYTTTEETRTELRTYRKPVFTWKIKIRFRTETRRDSILPDDMEPDVVKVVSELFPTGRPWYAAVRKTHLERVFAKDGNGYVKVRGHVSDYLYSSSPEYTDTVRTEWDVIKLDMSKCKWAIDDEDYVSIKLKVTYDELRALVPVYKFSDSGETRDKFDWEVSGQDGIAFLDVSKTFMPYVPRQRLVSE